MELQGLSISSLLIVLLAFSECSVASENVTCNSLRTLAQALIDNDQNLLNLTQVFYPTRHPPAKFLKVTYLFEDEMGLECDNCSVTYLWASGGFLLIQPISIFQFTSLLFNHKVGAKDSLVLTLPSPCRQLVLSSNEECACDDKNEDILDLFTHQVCSSKIKGQII